MSVAAECLRGPTRLYKQVAPTAPNTAGRSGSLFAAWLLDELLVPNLPSGNCRVDERPGQPVRARYGSAVVCKNMVRSGGGSSSVTNLVDRDQDTGPLLVSRGGLLLVSAEVGGGLTAASGKEVVIFTPQRSAAS
jgi:hypothetical protein